MRRTRFLSLVMAASLVASSFLFIPGKDVNAAEKKVTDLFPDNKVQEWALKKVDTDHNTKLSDSEINAVTSISIGSYNVSDLSGIEIFTNLKSLYCYKNNLTSLNVSSFQNLETLSCYDNKLTSITFGDNNLKLKTIHCYGNQLTGLTTSKLKGLEELDCSGNKITSLNFTNNLKLKKLICYSNSLSGNVSSLKINNCSNLYYLSIYGNQFTNFDLLGSKFTKLTYLNCGSNKFTSLDVSSFTSLTSLICYSNKIGTLDVSKLTSLQTLSCYSCNLLSLDVSKNTSLTYLKCNSNYNLSSLDLSNNTELTSLSIYYTNLKSIDLSGLSKLTYLDCEDNSMTSLDVSKNTALETLYCSGNTLTSLDLSKNVNLDTLSCYSNLLTKLDLSKNTNLTCLYCSSNKLTALDLSNLIKLEYVDCDNNRLTSLTFGNHPEIIEIDCSYNRLTSLKVPSEVSRVYCYFNSINELDISANERLIKLISTTEPKNVSLGLSYSANIDNYNMDITIDDDTKIITSTPTPTPTQAPTQAPTNIDPSGNSGEQILGFVNRLYQYVLGREPEKEGAQYWTNELYNFRKTGAEVAQGFIFSKEFIDKNTSNKDFVTILYKTFFGRDPEAEGLNYWVGQLDSGSMSRERVANGFIFSQEWADKCAEYGIRSGGDIKPSGDIKPTSLTYGFVERMYNKALGRDYDSEGREYWASQLANYNLTGEQLGVQFFLSDEMNKKGISNEEFVKRLYLTFMDREGETDGVNYWVGQLNGGASRSSVVYGFTRSAEFVEKCINARIMPY